MHSWGLCLFSLLGLTQAQRWLVPDLLNVVSDVLNISNTVTFPITTAQTDCPGCNTGNYTGAISATAIPAITVPLEFGGPPTFCNRNRTVIFSGICECPPGYAMVALRCTSNCGEMNGTCLPPSSFPPSSRTLWRLSENVTTLEATTGISCPVGTVFVGIECTNPDCSIGKSQCRSVEVQACNETMDYDDVFTCQDSFVGKVRTTDQNEEVKLPVSPYDGSEDYEVVWENELTPGVDGKRFAFSGIHKFRIRGRFYLSYENSGAGLNPLQLVSIESWGGFKVHPNYTKAFQGCENLQVSATGQPIFLPFTSLEGLFTDCKSLNSVFSWDLTNVTSLRGMFQGAKLLNSSIDFTSSSNVKDMSAMFMQAESFNSPLTLSTSSVTNMSFMFHEAFAFNQPVAFDTSSVVTMRMMFSNAVSFNQIIDFDTSQVYDMYAMFADARSFNGIFQLSDYTQVMNMASMFEGASSFDRMVSGSAPAVRTLANMFKSATNFNSSVTLDVTSNLSTVEGMFMNASRFNRDFTISGSSAITSTAGMFNYASNFNQNVTMNTTNVTDMSFMFANTGSFNQNILFSMDNVVSAVSMFADAAVFNSPILSNTPKLVDISSMFQRASLFNQPLSLDTTFVISMKFLLASASSFNNFLAFDTGSVLNMESMFSDAISFDHPIDWKVSNVKIMRNMFAGAAKFNQPLSFNTSSVTDMSGMFRRAYSFQRPLSFDTSNVENMNSMFEDATSFNSSLSFNTRNVRNMTSMYQNTASFNQQLVFNTSNVINMDEMFKSATNLTEPPVFSSTSNVKTMAGMFEHAILFNSNLTFDTSAVVDMRNMFFNATIFDSYVSFNTSNVAFFDGMFQAASAFNKPVLFDVHNADSMNRMFAQAISFNQTVSFENSNKLQRISSMFEDARSFNQRVSLFTGNVADMDFMFKGAELFNQPLSFTTPVVSTMAFMFCGAIAYNQPIFFDTGSVWTMEGMFQQASAFNRIISFSDTSKVSVYDSMFEDAESFNQPIDFNTVLADSMQNMFKGAENFNQPLSFDTTLVRSMYQMFQNASSFIQDLSAWDTMRVANCLRFCDVCGLPTFSKCNPCLFEPLSSRSWRVCYCPPGEYVVVDHCENATRASPTSFSLAPTPGRPGTIIVPYTNINVTVNISGVGVGLPSDPIFGGNGTFVITVSNATTQTLSVVITVVFLGPYGNEKNISGLRNPIVFWIPIPPGVSDPVKVCEGETPVLRVPECGWLNTQTQKWVTSDCTTINLTATQVQCSCTHLTDFAFITPEFNHIPIERLVDLSPENVEVHPGGLITVMVVLMIFGCILVISLRKDNEEKRHFAELTTYKHAKWDREAAAVDPNFWTRWLKRFRIGLQTHHTWGSLLFRRSGTSFRSVDRAFVTLMLVFILMSLSARFHARDQTFIGRVEVVIYSVLAAFCPNLLLAHLFRQTGEIGFYEKWQLDRGLMKPHKYRVLRYRFAERWRYVWYGMVLVCVLSMIIYILSIALMFDQNPWYYCRGKATASWIIDFITPYVITIFVVEPVKVATIVISRQLMQHPKTGLELGTE